MQVSRRGPTHRTTIQRIEPYIPGKPIEEVQREFGIENPIKLASNENPLGPSPRAVAALAAWADTAHRYPDGACRRLKAALADRHGVTPEHLVIGNGSDEVIKMISEAYLDPDDEVLFADPTFSEYAYAGRLMGASEIAVPLCEYRHDLPAMLQRVNPRTKIVFLCNPNNPTGTIVHRDEVVGFIQALPDDVLVVMDEAYADYVTDPDYPDSLEWIRAGLPVVMLRTFSKIYGLAGLRVGYGIATPEVAATIARVREPFNVNAAAQVAALAALQDGEYVQASKRLNEAGKAYLTEELSRLGCDVVPTQANFLFVNVHQDCRQVFQRLLRQGVIVRTGDVFGCGTHIRITVGSEPENRRLVQALELCLDRRERVSQ